MAGDKYTAVWVSHSTINDFLSCPRAYYLKNIYRDSKTGHKIKLMSPPLALGSAVHEVLESLSILPTQQRFSESLIGKFNEVWKKFVGKKGGFLNEDSEMMCKKRGEDMLLRVMHNPGPLVNPAVKIRMDLPYYWLSLDDNIILCGKIDWLEYIPMNDTVRIIDFKTSKNEEKSDSLQLPIYTLLVHNCQKRRASKASYWYLDRDDGLVDVSLPDIEEAHGKVLEHAKQIKLARQLERFKCKIEGGCEYCRPFEMITKGEAEFVGVDTFNSDIYIVDSKEVDLDANSVIL